MPEHGGEANNDKGRKIAEHNLAQQRRPIEGEKRADAADRESHDQARGERQPTGDQMHPVAHGLDRVLVEMSAQPLRCGAEQPFQAKAESGEEGEKQCYPRDPMVHHIGPEHAEGVGELGRQAVAPPAASAAI